MRKVMLVGMQSPGISGGKGRVSKFFEYLDKENLGNFTHTGTCTITTSEIRELLEGCGKRGVYIEIGEILNRFKGDRNEGVKDLTPEEFREWRKGCGKYFLGRASVGEIGGNLQWPHPYTKARARHLRISQKVQDLKEAYEELMRIIRWYVKKEREFDDSPLISVEAGMIYKYLLEGGFDKVCVELFSAQNNDLMISAARGASRMYGKTWGVDNAYAWYGGYFRDNLWKTRVRLSYYYCFIAGAESIFSEYGTLEDFSYDYKEGEDSEVCRFNRRVLKEFYEFVKSHPRPIEGPLTRIAVIHGHLDGCPNGWNRYIWGQARRGWEYSASDDAWRHFEKFYTRSPWDNNILTGEENFTGNPPLGQVDVIPAEAPADFLKNYACIIFLGRNIMTEEIYRNLIEYVKDGGRLFIALDHFQTDLRPNADYRIFREGDISELTGVKISGKTGMVRCGIKFIRKPREERYNFPYWSLHRIDPKFMTSRVRLGKVELTGENVLPLAVISNSPHGVDTLSQLEKSPPVFLENPLGKGWVYLINYWSGLGHPDLELFMRMLFQVIVQGEQGKIKVTGGPSVRYSVYREGDMIIIYLLNTSVSETISPRIYLGENSVSIPLPPAFLKTVTCRYPLMVVDEEMKVDVEDIRIGKGEGEIRVKGEGEIQVISLSPEIKSIRVIGEGAKEKKLSMRGESLRLKTQGGVDA